MIIGETEKNNMVFSSLNFMFVFLPIVFGIYFISPRKIRNFILFIASLVFYAWGEPFYVVLMLFSTILNFVYGALVQKYKGKTSAKWILASSVVLNLGILGFFKYTDFFIGNINAWFGTSIPLLNLTLPIGISFYTFQMMSYVIDVYRGDAAAQKNFVSFGAYVALFPQLVAGPIVLPLRTNWITAAKVRTCLPMELCDLLRDWPKRFYWPTPLVRFGRSFQPWKFPA